MVAATVGHQGLSDNQASCHCPALKGRVCLERQDDFHHVRSSLEVMSLCGFFFPSFAPFFSSFLFSSFYSFLPVRDREVSGG